MTTNLARLQRPAGADVQAARPRRVLIVEDEAIVQLHLARVVTDCGHEVVGPASSAEGALQAAAARTPDVALLDVRLASAVDGVDLARTLRERYDCAVVFVTAATDEATIARIEAVQASGYVVKPFRQAEIRLALGSALRERPPAHVVPLDPPSPPRRPHHNARVLLYSHDTLGLGHLQRSLNLARAILQRDTQVSVLLATGSPVAHRFTLPPGSDSVKLPAVRKVAAEDYAARSLDLSGDEILRMRTNLLLRTVRDFEPDVLIVDHAPQGMRGEMLPALRWLAANSSCCKVLGLRDIIDDPASVCDAWTRDGVYDTVAGLYDQVNVYGMQSIFDVTTAYGFPAAVAAKTRFVGYVTGQADDEEPGEALFESPARPLVVVTIGGGEGGADAVIGNYLRMLHRHHERVDFDTIVLTGPLVPGPVARDIAAEAVGLPVTVRDFVPSARPYIRRADLVVCTAGYNTMTEVLSLAPRAIVIPRILHRQEQQLRAERLAALGLVEVLLPDQVTPDDLFARVRRQLYGSSRPLEAARAAHLIHFDGAEHVAQSCEVAARRALANSGGLP